MLNLDIQIVESYNKIVTAVLQNMGKGILEWNQKNLRKMRCTLKTFKCNDLF